MATKKKPTSVDEAIAASVIAEIKANQKVSRAILEAGLLGAKELGVDLPPIRVEWIEDRPEVAIPQPAPLVPDKWWENAAQASAPIDYGRAILVVSPQVAEVLNIGIDRTVDLLKKVDDDLKRTHAYYRERENHAGWMRQFLRNVKDRLSTGTPTIETVLQVIEGIDQVLEEQK